MATLPDTNGNDTGLKRGKAFECPSHRSLSRRPAPRKHVCNPLAGLPQDIRDRSDILADRRRRQNRLIRQAEALGYSRVLRRNRLLSDYDLAELQDYIDDRRNLGTFTDECSREYSRANGRIRRVLLYYSNI
jgi:hypothetical protein